MLITFLYSYKAYAAEMHHLFLSCYTELKSVCKVKIFFQLLKVEYRTCS